MLFVRAATAAAFATRVTSLNRKASQLRQGDIIDGARQFRRRPARRPSRCGRHPALGRQASRLRQRDVIGARQCSCLSGYLLILVPQPALQNQDDTRSRQQPAQHAGNSDAGDGAA